MNTLVIRRHHARLKEERAKREAERVAAFGRFGDYAGGTRPQLSGNVLPGTVHAADDAKPQDDSVPAKPLPVEPPAGAELPDPDREGRHEAPVSDPNAQPPRTEPHHSDQEREEPTKPVAPPAPGPLDPPPHGEPPHKPEPQKTAQTVSEGDEVSRPGEPKPEAPKPASQTQPGKRQGGQGGRR